MWTTPSAADVVLDWPWVKKMPTQTGTTGFGLFFLLLIGFFRYPVFLTHSHVFAGGLRHVLGFCRPNRVVEGIYTLEFQQPTCF